MQVKSSASPMPTPIRVLHVLEATLGGTLRYLENVAAATTGPEFVSGFAYGTSRADTRLEPFLGRITDLGWVTYPIDMRRQVDFRRDVPAMGKLRSAIRSFRPDVIHCHSSKAGALGRIAASSLRRGPACLYSPHALAVSLGNIYLQVERLLSKRTHGFLAVSASERNQIVNFSLARENAVDVVYPSVDSAYFSPQSKLAARTLLGIGNGPLLLAIGRLTLQKNPEEFVEIVKAVRRQHASVKGVWLGAGTGELELQSKIDAEGLQNVIQVVPWQHDVRPLIAAADVFVSTSRFESFGYVTAEALSMECPAVATDVTGTRDIMVGPLKDWLYRVGDHAAAAGMISHLLSNPSDAARVGRFGRSEMQRLFSEASMRSALQEIYRKTVLRSSPPFWGQPATAARGATFKQLPLSIESTTSRVA